MSLLHTMKALDLLDSAYVSGESVKEALIAGGVKEENISVKTVTGPKGGSTDFVKVWFYGSEGRHKGGSASAPQLPQNRTIRYPSWARRLT